MEIAISKAIQNFKDKTGLWVDIEARSGLDQTTFRKVFLHEAP